MSDDHREEKQQRLLIVTSQYRTYNRQFYTCINHDPRLSTQVLWIRDFREDDRLPEPLASELQHEIVGATSIRVGDYSVRSFLRLSEAGIPSAKISRLGYYGHEIGDRPISDAALKADLGIDNKRVILYLGRITTRKGLRELIMAFPEILNKEMNAVLLVCGGAEDVDHSTALRYEEECHELAGEMGQGRILFSGQIDPSEKQNYYWRVPEILLDEGKVKVFSENSRRIFEEYHQSHLIADRILEAAGVR